MSLSATLQSWLGAKAARVIARERPLVIAVTGSVGKSTTKQAIGAVLKSDQPENAVRVPAGSYNNELGLPLTIFGVEAPGRNPFKWIALLAKAWAMSVGLKKTGIKIFVLEMGADKPGDIDYLTRIAPPDIAVVTAVTTGIDPTLVPVHAANYPNIDALINEKSILVKRLNEGGMAVLNADDPKVFAMRHLTDRRVFTFGEAEGTDIRLLSNTIVSEETPEGMMPKGLSIVLELYHRRTELFLPGVYGTSIGYAFAAAFCAGYALDVLPEDPQTIIPHFSPAKGRARIIPGIKHTTLFDDSYNASPASVIQSIRDLASVRIKPGQKKIACIGEMRELGEKASDMHRRVGAEAAKAGIDVLVCCGIFGPVLAEGALANGMRPDQVKVVSDTPEAGLLIQEMLKPGDIVLAKASQGTFETKGVRMERVIKELMAEPLRASELLVRQEPAWQRK
ncbi:MAG TPA: UDP-N-acetylmuramoyl-tripeptide--D-alanyl-D-alanine ligase [Verrucomicrobiae bacterium]|nr:UDP-N-acetylmuramoyl-tripeptide--D-alanyl-D-alanine ligase [Verrucomicrobiae bacterium]